MKDAYVKEHIVEKYQQEYDEWESQRRAFEEGEAKQERLQNEAYEKVYTEKRDILVTRLEGKTELLSGEIERILTESSIPFRKHISCKVRCSANAVLIDVQLPPAGLFPSEGLVSLKTEQQRQSRRRRSACAKNTPAICSAWFSTLPQRCSTSVPLLNRLLFRRMLSGRIKR